MKTVLVAIFICCWGTTVFTQDLKNPSFEEVLSLQSPSNAVISPDGHHVVYEVQSTDWKENRYDRELWLSKDGAEPFQLTNNLKGSSQNPKWSPDGSWICFVSNRKEKSQLQAIRLAGGEAFQITQTEFNINAYEWSPDGTQIVFIQSQDGSKEDKERKEKFGSYAVDDGEYQLDQLWTVEFDPGRLNYMPQPEQLEDSIYKESIKPKPLLDSIIFSINNFKWSPDGLRIAIEHQPNPLINSFFKADISILDIETKAINPFVEHASYDGLIGWSPDGKSILYTSNLEDSTSNYYLNRKIFRKDLNGTNQKQLAQTFDEQIYGLTWNQNGIFAIAWQKTKRPMLKIDPQSGQVEIVAKAPERIWGFTFSEDGSQIAFTGADDNTLTEVFWDVYPMGKPKQITDASKQIMSWASAESEVISWNSKDGQLIEGVIHKPKDYDPARRYPLMVIIHGGPTGISTPNPAPSSVYPIIQWLNKGALVLRPNYRGSAGYGEAFRSLNVRNLGVGDAWDVLSGVEYLEKEGLIDGEKVGCMGWSQGGYISAFLTTNSDKFKAVSVGAGISNWMTYYVNTDIHPFTRQYLKATPWSDQAIYEKTSPMTNIRQASTPTLIQHGEFDRRVPTANAYELVQGLRDVGVTSKLIIYKGFGHGINKPKERLAAVWHNWQWFGKYIWGEEIELPKNK